LSALLAAVGGLLMKKSPLVVKSMTDNVVGLYGEINNSSERQQMIEAFAAGYDRAVEQGLEPVMGQWSFCNKEGRGIIGWQTINSGLEPRLVLMFALIEL
jgi:hypothetical protein